MGLLKRSSVAAPPPLAREVVQVPALGGDVVVVELSLQARLDFERVLRDHRGVADVHAMVPHLLAATVRIDGDEPLYSVEQWQAFGARHSAVAIELFNAAMRLSGFNGEDETKN